MPKAGFGSFEFNQDFGFYHTADLNKINKAEGSPASRALQARGRAAGQGHAESGAGGAGVRTEEKMSMAHRVTPRSAPGSKSRQAPGMMSKAAPKKTTDIEHAKQATVSKKAGLALDFSPNNILNGIILSEILGKPKCLRNTFRR